MEVFGELIVIRINRIDQSYFPSEPVKNVFRDFSVLLKRDQHHGEDFFFHPYALLYFDLLV